MLKSGPEESDFSDNQDLDLILAAYDGNLEGVKVLLERGANIDAVTQDGFTALVIASQCGRHVVVKALLERGAKIDAVTQDGSTALMLASQNGHHDVVMSLLEKGANIEAANQVGGTALMVASQCGHHDVVKALLDKGANINAVAQNGITALMLVSQNCHPEIVKLLLQKNPDFTLRDKYGRTALDIAIDEGDSVACAQLLAHAQSKKNNEAPFRSLVSEQRRKKMYDARSRMLKDHSLYYAANSLLHPQRDERDTEETFAEKEKNAQAYSLTLEMSGLSLEESGQASEKKKNLAFKQGLALLFSSNNSPNYPGEALPEEIRWKILNYCTGPLTFDKSEEEKAKRIAQDVYKPRFGM